MCKRENKIKVPEEPEHQNSNQIKLGKLKNLTVQENKETDPRVIRQKLVGNSDSGYHRQQHVRARAKNVNATQPVE